jgi:hypothetical protein
VITESTALAAMMLVARYGEPIEGGILGQTLVSALWGPAAGRDAARRRAGRLIDIAASRTATKTRAIWVDLAWEIS